MQKRAGFVCLARHFLPPEIDSIGRLIDSIRFSHHRVDVARKARSQLPGGGPLEERHVLVGF